jgi:hypothetical protein
MKTLSLFSLAFLVACGSKPATDDETDSGVAGDSGDTEDTEEDIVPEEGVYIADLIEFTQDECEMEQGELEEILESDVALRFTLAGSDLYMEPMENGEVDDEAFTCSMNAGQFLCPIMSEENELGEEFEAVVILKMDVVGAWDSNTHIAGSLNLDYSCRGPDCEEALEASEIPIDIPCSTKIAFAGSKTE